MNAILSFMLKLVGLLPRAAVITVLLAAPVLAVPSMRGDAGQFLVQPDNRNSGAGFVLLINLRRASE